MPDSGTDLIETFRWEVRSQKVSASRISYSITPEELEKFAELIIKECIATCMSRVGCSDYNTGRMHCVSDIKEHFGVD